MLKKIFNKNAVEIIAVAVIATILTGAFIYFIGNEKKFEVQNQNVQIETITHRNHEYVYMLMITKTGNEITQSSGLTHSPDCSYCNNMTHKK